MTRRKHRSGVSAAGEDAVAVLRDIFSNHPGIHPEIWARWPRIAGPELARRAWPQALHGRTLVLAVRSSVWMQELSYLERRLLDALADAVGPGVVEKIRLVLDAPPAGGGID
jgi:hypothetical protein